MPAETAHAPIHRRDLIDGLGKGLRVIEAFDDDHAQLTPSETAQRTKRRACRAWCSRSSSASRRSAPPQWLTIGYVVGVRVPAHVVTPGPAILSTFADAALDAWIGAHAFAAFTARTVTDPARFRDDVLRARALGYAHTEAQLDAGLRGMSLPLIDRRGRCRGALGMTVSLPAYRDGVHMVDAVLPLLQETAQALRPVL